MRKPEQQVTAENYFDMIPVDVFINQILSRLSVKSMGKCRSVSKLWSSILRPRNHNLLFPIKSSDQPRFLFTFASKGWVFFSVPQPVDPDDNSSLVVTSHYYTESITYCYRYCPQSIRGLVCGLSSQHIRRDQTFALISNPIRGQIVTTPILRKEFESKVGYKFGYDPIEEHFKVLCLIWFTCGTNNKLCLEQYVITLETGILLWRKIQCCNLYYPLFDDGVCINGIIYYTAETDYKKRMIVCFDVRYETFGFIDLDQDLVANIRRPLILINYKDKLGVIDEGRGRNQPFKMWVLEDAEECKWSKHVFDKPYPCSSFAGMTDRGDIVFYPEFAVENPIYISYYKILRAK